MVDDMLMRACVVVMAFWIAFCAVVNVFCIDGKSGVFWASCFVMCWCRACSTGLLVGV